VDPCGTLNIARQGDERAEEILTGGCLLVTY
jgi:hypothetical protein